MRANAIVGTERTQAIIGLLHAWGLDTHDFDIEDCGTCGVENLLGVDGGVLSIRCRSTGEERLYANGAESAWFGAVFMDLAHGHFAHASGRLGTASHGRGGGVVGSAKLAK